VGSLDEQECISPTDAKQWMFDRARGQSSLDVFLSNNADIEEEDEEEFDRKDRRDSENYQLPELNDIDKAKLLSCMEEIRSIIGDTYSDKQLVEAIMTNSFDFQKALDMLLSSDVMQKPKTVVKPAEMVEKGMSSLCNAAISVH